MLTLANNKAIVASCVDLGRGAGLEKKFNGFWVA